MEVRNACPTDTAFAGRVATFVNQAYQRYYAPCLEDAAAYTRVTEEEVVTLMSEQDRTGRRLVLAWMDSAPVGCATLSLRWDGEASLGHYGMLASDPAVHRVGVGTSLLDRIESECISAGMEQIQCEEYVLRPDARNHACIRMQSCLRTNMRGGRARRGVSLPLKLVHAPGVLHLAEGGSLSTVRGTLPWCHP